MSILTRSPRGQRRHSVLGILGLLAFLGAGLLIAPGQADAQSHACIESDEVQHAANASGASVGNEIITDNWEHYFVTKGGPTCTLDPTTCDSSLNLYVVDDVKKCLAANAADDAPADTATDTATHSTVSVGSLAHTGVEHELGGAFAVALIGAGCAALGLGREGRRRRNQ